MENMEKLPIDLREFIMGIVKEELKRKYVEYIKNMKIEAINRKIKGKFLYEAYQALDAIDAMGSSIEEDKGTDFAIVIDREGYEIKARAMVHHHLGTLYRRGLMDQYEYEEMMLDTMNTNEKYFLMHNGVWDITSTIHPWYEGPESIIFIVSNDGLTIRDDGNVMKMKKM